MISLFLTDGMFFFCSIYISKYAQHVTKIKESKEFRIYVPKHLIVHYISYCKIKGRHNTLMHNINSTVDTNGSLQIIFATPVG